MITDYRMLGDPELSSYFSILKKCKLSDEYYIWLVKKIKQREEQLEHDRTSINRSSDGNSRLRLM